MYKVYITGPGEDDFKDLPQILSNVNESNQTVISINNIEWRWYVVVKEPLTVNMHANHLDHAHRSLETIEGEATEVDDEVR